MKREQKINNTKNNVCSVVCLPTDQKVLKSSRKAQSKLVPRTFHVRHAFGPKSLILNFIANNMTKVNLERWVKQYCVCFSLNYVDMGPQWHSPTSSCTQTLTEIYQLSCSVFEACRMSLLFTAKYSPNWIPGN